MAKGLYINETEFKTLSQIEIEKLSKQVATRSVVDGSFASFLNILPDPDPVLKKMGMEMKVYKNLLTDDQVFSARQRRKLYVKSRKWKIQKGKLATDQEVDLCQRAVENLTKNDGKRKNRLNDIISQALDTPYWGYKVFEITWEINKEWLPRFSEDKPSEWFIFDDDCNLLLKTQEHPEGIPLNTDEYKHKFILLQNEPSYENPYGTKLLSKCFWPVAFKRGGWKFWSVFVEKYGMPFLYGKLPRSSEQEEYNDFLDSLENMVQDAVAVIPEDGSIDVLDAKGGSSGEIYKQYLDTCDNAIAKVILTNTLSMDIQDKGAKAGVEAHQGVEPLIGDEDAEFVKEVFNSLFKSIIDLNKGNGKYPVFDIYDKEEKVNKELSERDNNLSGNIKFTKKYYQKAYKLEEDDFELIEDDTNPNSSKEFSERKTEKADWLESIMDSLPPEMLNDSMGQALKPVFDLVNSGADFNNLMEKLFNLYPEMNTDQAEELLQKIIFIAQCEGGK